MLERFEKNCLLLNLYLLIEWLDQFIILGGVYIVTIIFMMQPALPKILSTLKIVDNNVTGEFPFPVDYYGLDLDRYYYYLLLHSVIAVTSILTVISAADTMFIVHVQHACAMFTIVGWVIRNDIRNINLHGISLQSFEVLYF